MAQTVTLEFDGPPCQRHDFPLYGGKLDMGRVEAEFGLQRVHVNNLPLGIDPQGLSREEFQPGAVIKITGTMAAVQQGPPPAPPAQEVQLWTSALPSGSAVSGDNNNFVKMLAQCGWQAYRTWGQLGNIAPCNKRHGMPLVAVSKAIAEFEQHLDTAAPAHCIENALDLCTILHKVHIDEVRDLQPPMLSFFQRWFRNPPFTCVPGKHGTGVPDVKVQFTPNQQQQQQAVVVVVEEKLDKGGNAMGQAMKYYMDELHQVRHSQLLCSYMPTLLITVTGTLLQVGGVAFTDAPLFEPLADVTCVLLEPNVQRVAQVLHAVEQALEQLTQEHQQVMAAVAASPLTARLPQLRFPYILSTHVAFQGAQPHPTSFVRVFRLSWADKADTYVKLVRLTGQQQQQHQLPVAAQRAYAELDLAPRVLDCIELGANWLAVHSEGLNPTDGWKTLHQLSPHCAPLLEPPGVRPTLDEWNNDIGPEVQRQRARAHQQAVLDIGGRTLQVVHGDLRLSNIFVKLEGSDIGSSIAGGSNIGNAGSNSSGARSSSASSGEASSSSRRWRVKFVDFDWSGVNGESQYPCIMNSKIRWPAGVGPGQVMTQQHDIDLLSYQLAGRFAQHRSDASDEI